MQIDSLQIAQTVYNESRFWIALFTFAFSVFKGVQWVRAIKENDLHHLQLGVNDLKSGIDDVKNGLHEQTDALITELRELRSDFRAFYPPSRRGSSGSPQLVSRSAPRPARKRRTIN